MPSPIRSACLLFRFCFVSVSFLFPPPFLFLSSLFPSLLLLRPSSVVRRPSSFAFPPCVPPPRRRILRKNVRRERVAIIGAGTVGQVLGRRLRESGRYEILSVCRRDLARARKAARWIGGGRPLTDSAEASRGATLILIATPDREIAGVARSLAASPNLNRNACVLHVSGALPSGVLGPARRRSAAIAAAHPLQSFPDPRTGRRRLKGTWWACEGDRQALPRVRRLVRTCGGRVFAVRPAGKAAYHAGAALASNALVALVDLAVEACGRAGISPKTALAALLPLMRGTLENVERLGPVRALTGPIARGDVETVARHRRALRPGRGGPDLWRTVAALGRRTLTLALAKGTCDGRAARALRGILADDTK